MSRLARYLLLAGALLGLCRGQLGLSTEDMQNAVDTLAARFETVRNEGLGIDLLEGALRDVPFTTSTLSDQDITNLLTANTLQTAINNVVGIFDQVAEAAMEDLTTPTQEPQELCCDENTPSTEAVCVYPSPEGQINPSILNTFTSNIITDASEIVFGGVDGGLIRDSSNPLPDDCQERDARLMPWFANGARGTANPIELVLLLDTVRLSDMITDEHVDLVKAAASLIINSLTTADKVGVVSIDNPSRKPSVIKNTVIPVCTDTIFELDSFVTSFNPRETSGTAIEFPAAFNTALSLFSSSTDAEQIFLYLTVGTASGIRIHTPPLSTNIQDTLDGFPNIVNRQVYRARNDMTLFYDVIGSSIFLDSGPLAHVVGGYYSTVVDSNPPSNAATIAYGHALGDAGNSLTLRRNVFNDTEFLGVLYAVVPFSQSLTELLETVRYRDYSYPFVLDQDRTPLFHPLLPGDIVAEVGLVELEPEGVVMVALDSNSATPVPVTKTHFIYTGATDFHSLAYRAIPSNYFCHVMSVPSNNLTVCYVLAEEERTLRSIDVAQVDIEDQYSSLPAPVYHNLGLSMGDSNFCNYFCKLSLTTHVSYQLTTPSMPDSDDTESLVDTLTEYIEGRVSDTPTFVREGVAEEAAVAVSLSEAWLDVDSNSSDYITRRHLATPNGLYLTYPPTHLVPEFTPTQAEWYRAPSAHPSLLTLSPPHVDPLIEGSRLTVSVGYALRPPTSQDDANLGDEGPPFAVVSGDITINSLRVFVREALPECDQNQLECIIVDDNGNLVYEDSRNLDGEASFFGRSGERLRLIVSNLTGLATKRQCTELFNVQLSTRRFYTLNTELEDVMRNPPNHCGEYLVQHIPETNAFLVVYEEGTTCNNVLCTCGTSCFNCDDFNPAFCECPCNCSAQACETPTEIPVCPRIFNQDTNFDRVIAEELDTFSEVPFCFDQQCSCRMDFDSCFGVRECHWCEAEKKCAQLTECCSSDEGPDCCSTERELSRLAVFFPTCGVFEAMCNNNPVLNETCPRVEPTSPGDNSTSTIVAAVIGALIGLVLIILIILLVVYYQVCRKVDPTEENSRESAFDFSNKTAMTAVSVKSNSSKGKNSKTSSDAEVEKGTVEENGNVDEVKEKTPPKEESTL